MLAEPRSQDRNIGRQTKADDGIFLTDQGIGQALASAAPQSDGIADF